jgi:hypothetical protein
MENSDISEKTFWWGIWHVFLTIFGGLKLLEQLLILGYFDMILNKFYENLKKWNLGEYT